MDKLKELLKKHGITDAAALSEIDDAVEAYKDQAVETEVTGLKKKNAELITKYKDPAESAKDKMIELETQLSEKDSALAKAQKDLEAAKGKLAAAEKDRDDKVAAANGTVSNLLIDQGLTSALAGKVKTGLLAGAKNLHLGAFKVEYDEAGKPKAVATVKDKDGKERKLDPATFVSEWLASEDGKEYALGAQASGGGASGSGSQVNNPSSIKARYDVLNAKKPEELTHQEGLELVTLAGQLGTEAAK